MKKERDRDGFFFDFVKAMYGFVFILLALVPAGLDAASLNSSAGIGGNTLSIEDAIHMALGQNPDIKMVREEVMVTEAILKKTSSLFLPRISVYSEYSTGDAPSAYLFKTIDQRELPSALNFNDPGSFNNFETGVATTWNLYKGGVDTLNTKIAALSVSETRAGLHDTKNRIVASVIRLFFSVLKADEYAAIAKQSVETVQEQLRIMGIRFEGGGVLKSDLLSLKVRLAEAKKDLVEAENLYTKTLTAFNRVLGKKPDDGVVLSRTCECPVTFPETWDAALEMALEKRPEMIKAKERLEMARMELKKADAGYLPRVDMNARYYMDSESLSYDFKNDNYMAALTMNWDVYTGMSTRADRLKARHGLEKAGNYYKKIELDIVEDVRHAYLSMEDAVQRFKVAKTSVDLADESLGIVTKRYEGGAVPVTRYLETELARARARINRTAAFYDRKIALSEIGRALGVLSQIWKKENE